MPFFEQEPPRVNLEMSHSIGQFSDSLLWEIIRVVEVSKHLLFELDVLVRVNTQPLLDPNSDIWTEYAKSLEQLCCEVSSIGVVPTSDSGRSLAFTENTHFTEHLSWDEGSDFLDLLLSPYKHLNMSSGKDINLLRFSPLHENVVRWEKRLHYNVSQHKGTGVLLLSEVTDLVDIVHQEPWEDVEIDLMLEWGR